MRHQQADHFGENVDIEATDKFIPRYDASGLLTVVVTDVESGKPLVVAHMNHEAFQRTVETGFVHFWSRSRKSLWKKGETSGHFLEVREIRIDCDQDALWISAHPHGPTCHTGNDSCFYRRVNEDGSLIRS